MKIKNCFIYCALLCISSTAWGQEQIGTLLYRTLTGRGITLVIVDAGPGAATTKPEQEDAEKFRQFVRAYCVNESSLDRSARVLKELPPDTYISANGKGAFVRTATMTYWRYAPGMVLPARFRWNGQVWELITANVPDRILK